VTDIVVIGGIFRELLPDGTRRMGGSGFVAALTAQAFGADVALVSFVGEQDERGLRALARHGIDVSAVQVLPGAAGTFSFVDERDQRAPRPVYRAADTIPAATAPPDIPSAPVVVAFGFPDFDPREWIRKAVHPDGAVIWDYQGWLSRQIEDKFFESLPVDRRVSVANLAEAKDTAGTETAFPTLTKLPRHPFDVSLVKAGRWGTIVATKDLMHLVGAFTTTVGSSIGSGDCFAGALGAAMAAGDEPRDAAIKAAAAASIFVGRAGNRPPPKLDTGVRDLMDTGRQIFVSPVTCEDIRVYLAGPWFSVAERTLILELEAVLGHMGLDVVSPRRDIRELAADASAEEVIQVGVEDYRAIDRCALMVAVLDHDDPGTLMEVGYAYRAGKTVIGLRSHADRGPQPMREAAGVRVVEDVGTLIEEVTEWVRAQHGLG
jgi:nucleoside 2-deoxyribosyltransferase/sugar/nucleoside kinase (ribokinase family)